MEHRTLSEIEHGIVDEDALYIASAALPWDKLTGKTVLISGALGYVPSYFVHAFLKRNDLFHAGIRVIALCRSEQRARERFAQYMGRADFELLLQDVCAPVAYERPVHFIIHAASPAGVSTRFVNCVDTYTANVIGSLNLLELARTNVCSGFLLVGSVDSYGNTVSQERSSEDTIGVLDGLNPRNAYSLGKRSAETLCACYRAQYNVPAVIARPVQIMGPGVALDDGRLHIDFISQMLGHGKIVLKSDGSAKRSFLYIADAILAMLLILLSGTPGQAYNVADEGGEASVLELAQLMAALCHEKKVDVVFDVSQRNTLAVTQAPAASLASSDKLRELGWVPRYSLEEGAARMMKAYGL